MGVGKVPPADEKGERRGRLGDSLRSRRSETSSAPARNLTWRTSGGTSTLPFTQVLLLASSLSVCLHLYGLFSVLSALTAANPRCIVHIVAAVAIEFKLP
ncbi:hypothetical protein DTO027B5_2636 [Paecilomyces variotii]|nr:hypothetical protein DTO027B3_2643 [Paecilomyces variotii]KAJ9335494.1 hypothetical protein DTO027B5_2636 [Paecilomyces variotii]